MPNGDCERARGLRNRKRIPAPRIPGPSGAAPAAPPQLLLAGLGPERLLTEFSELFLALRERG